MRRSRRITGPRCDRRACRGSVDALLIAAGWDRLAQVLHTLADEAIAGGHRFAFHPHTGTYVETPAEVERLVGATDPAVVGLCLDVGHYLVGGGDPVAALDRYGTRVSHVHLKDVDPHVLERLRGGSPRLRALPSASASSLELGAGALDLAGVLRSLASRRYNGWLMVEQDSSWGPPAEAAAIGRRVLAATLRMIAATDAAVAKGA